MKAGKHQSREQRCFGLCWKLPNRAQSFVLCSQIVTEEINAMFQFCWSVSSKVIGMLLNVVHSQVQKS